MNVRINFMYMVRLYVNKILHYRRQSSSHSEQIISNASIIKLKHTMPEVARGRVVTCTILITSMQMGISISTVKLNGGGVMAMHSTAWVELAVVVMCEISMTFSLPLPRKFHQLYAELLIPLTDENEQDRSDLSYTVIQKH